MEVNLDVLFRRIADEPDKRSKIPLLHNAIMVAINRDPQRALSAAHESVELAEQYGEAWSFAMSWLLMGRVFTVLARYIEGLAASEKAYRLFEEQGDRLNAAHALSDSGSSLISLSDYTRAFDVLSKGLALAEELGSDTAMVYSLNRMGYLWRRLENQPQALLYWQRGLAIAERLGSEELQSTISNNIAGIYVELGEHDRALEYFERNLAKALTRKDLYREAMSRVNIGELLQLKSHFAEALEHQSRALELFRTLGYTHFEGVLLSNMGRLFEKKGKLPEALQYQQEAVQMLATHLDKQDLVKVQIRLGVLYRRMGEPCRGIELLLAAGQTAIDIGSEHLQSKVSKQLSLSYEQQGNYKAALGEYQNYMKLRRIFMHANKASVADRVRLCSEVEGASREKEIQRIKNTELAGTLEKVQALSSHYEALNMQNTLLVDSVTRKLHAPLARIGEAARHMRESIDGEDDKSISLLLGSMELETRQASRTVDMLLQAHVLEAGKFVPEPEPFDVADLVEKVLDDFRDTAARSDIGLRLHVQERSVVVGDSGIIRQILNVLVSNAVLYSPRGCRVWADVALQSDMAIVRIGDSGPGLPRNLAQKFATPLASVGADQSFPPGSGLYIARSFAAAVRGTLRYERKKKRTSIILAFPVDSSTHA